MPKRTKSCRFDRDRHFVAKGACVCRHGAAGAETELGHVGADAVDPCTCQAIGKRGYYRHEPARLVGGLKHCAVMLACPVAGVISCPKSYGTNSRSKGGPP